MVGFYFLGMSVMRDITQIIARTDSSAAPVRIAKLDDCGVFQSCDTQSVGSSLVLPTERYGGYSGSDGVRCFRSSHFDDAIREAFYQTG